MASKHTSLAEVRMTIRREIANEQLFIDRATARNLRGVHQVMNSTAVQKAMSQVQAYKAVLMWLSDLEA